MCVRCRGKKEKRMEPTTVIMVGYGLFCMIVVDCYFQWEFRNARVYF